MRRNPAAPIAVAAFGWAVAVAVTGGFELRLFGLRLTSHRIPPAALAAAVASWIWYRNATSEGRDRLDARIRTWIARRERRLVAAAAAGALVIGLAFGTFVAAGSDAFGYLAQARLWASGRLVVPVSYGGWASWPLYEWALLPLGFKPGAEPGTGVPTYPPGLSILMAFVSILTPKYGAFLVVPLLGAVTVGLSARLARRIGNPAVAVATALLVLTSPVFLYQLVQPMSDVPVAAFWLLAFVAALEGGWAGSLGGGLAASVAIVIRPNLAPVAAPVLALTLASGSWRERLRNAALFAAGIVPGAALSAWNNAVLYGSPTMSGYGSSEDLFSRTRVLPNLSLYSGWLLETHTVFILAALAAPLVVSRQEHGRRYGWIALAFTAAVLACYLPYDTFDHWTYLRFLLPALPIVLAYSLVVLVAMSQRWLRHGIFAWGGVVLFMTLCFVHTAVANTAFGLKHDYRTRAVRVADQINARLGPDAAFICVMQSGSLRYHGGRDAVLRYDWIEPDRLEEVVAWLRDRRRTPYLLLEPSEIEPFRRRFSGATRLGRLDWPPAAVLDGDVRLYDPADADRLAAAAWPVGPRRAD